MIASYYMFSRVFKPHRWLIPWFPCSQILSGPKFLLCGSQALTWLITLIVISWVLPFPEMSRFQLTWAKKNVCFHNCQRFLNNSIIEFWSQTRCYISLKLGLAIKRWGARVSSLVVQDRAQDFSIPLQTLLFSAMRTHSCPTFPSTPFGRPTAFISLVDNHSNPSKSSSKLKYFMKSVMIKSTYLLSHHSSQCLALRQYV